jgi:hypothetical protein
MNNKIIWAVCLLILASLACQLPFLSVDDIDEFEKGLPGLDTDTFDATVDDPNLLAAAPLSAAQRQVLLVKGHPNRFLMMFSDGLREETWYFDQFGYEVTFRNGEIFTESGTDRLEDWVDFVTIYSPWQFNEAMGLNELLAISEAESFAIESLAEAFQEDLSLVYMKGLIAGLRGEDLLFVRTVPVGEGARTLDIPVSQPTAQGPSDAPASLTAAEQIHSGAHSYQVYCSYSDGTSEDIEDSFTWSFTDEGVYFDEEGPFPKVNINSYGVSDGDEEFFIYFQENAITLTGETQDINEEGEEMAITWACVFTQKP